MPVPNVTPIRSAVPYIQPFDCVDEDCGSRCKTQQYCDFLLMKEFPYSIVQRFLQYYLHNIRIHSIKSNVNVIFISPKSVRDACILVVKHIGDDIYQRLQVGHDSNWSIDNTASLFSSYISPSVTHHPVFI